MSVPSIVFTILLLGSIGFFLSIRRARGIEARGTKMHSRPHYYGWWTFLIIVLPSLFFLLFWKISINLYLEHQISVHIPCTMGSDMKSCSGFMDTLRTLVNQLRFVEGLPDYPDNHAVLHDILKKRNVFLTLYSKDYIDNVAQIAIELARKINRICIVGGITTFVFTILGFFFGIFSIAPGERSRNKVERITILGLATSSSIIILITVGIVLSMLFQAISFFQSVPLSNFIFGTMWDPRFSAEEASEKVIGQFGLLPLLAGTLYIAFIAVLFSIPIGLFSAIYMVEYATPWFRGIVKPLLEILAGIPTIVYGFLALVVVGPFLRNLSMFLAGGHDFIMAQSVLTAGLVMGIMLVPFVSSLSDDIIMAVPRSLRDGSFGLGATQSETIRKVVLPAALPGIIASFLLTASRAIGETMIVVLAAGVSAKLTLNPFEAMTTITVKIVNQLTGDLEFNSPQTLVAFALGMTLLMLTLLMNIVALYVVRKYREQYE